ncbi:SDR family oxidoreductase [Paramicrobacterium agarici]|nr:SDR family oxidoreductase [Microbacterium agarici]
MMNISDQVALVTGANRGIGREFVRELKRRGVARVYATARNPRAVDIAGVEVLHLDLLDHDSIARAAEEASDVTLLINNAGVQAGGTLVGSDLAELRSELDTHLFGTLDVIRSFAPVLAANGGGAITTVLSALSWFSFPGAAPYAVAKAAEWNMVNGVRLELAEHGTLVQGVHLGAADTDISAGYDGPKIHPAEVARATLDGLEARRVEVVVDDWSRTVKDALAHDPALFYAGAFQTV